MHAALGPNPQSRLTRNSFARASFALLALLSLVLQSLVLQTHVHVPQGQGIVAAIDIIALNIADGSHDAHGTKAGQNTKAPLGKYPLKDDTTHCSLCQQSHHNGQYLSPQAAAAYLPLYLHVSTIPLAEIAHIAGAISHAWKSRAPPSA